MVIYMLTLRKRIVAMGLFTAGVVLFMAADSVAAEVTRVQRGEARSRHVPDLEHRAAVRRIDSRITLLRAERAAYQRQLERLGPSSVFRYSTAFVWTLEETRLAILQIEQELDQLSDERLLLRHERAGR